MSSLSCSCRAIRTIAAGEDVLVWYSSELAVIIGVPELQSFHIKGEVQGFRVSVLPNLSFCFLASKLVR